MTAIAMRARAGGWLLPAALGLSAIHAVAAHVAVPFWPVPATLQPLSVLLVAGLCGPRLAVAAYLAYLAEGALGLPVFARGGGLAYLTGPTAGYLFGQLLASLMVGVLLKRAGRRPGVVRTVVVMLAGILAMYLPGAAWLSHFVGARRAVEAGILPFVLGDAAKAGIAASAVLLRRRAG